MLTSLKKLLSALLAVCICLSAVPAFAEQPAGSFDISDLTLQNYGLLQQSTGDPEKFDARWRATQLAWYIENGHSQEEIQQKVAELTADGKYSADVIYAALDQTAIGDYTGATKANVNTSLGETISAEVQAGTSLSDIQATLQTSQQLAQSFGLATETSTGVTTFTSTLPEAEQTAIDTKVAEKLTEGMQSATTLEEVYAQLDTAASIAGILDKDLSNDILTGSYAEQFTSIMNAQRQSFVEELIAGSNMGDLANLRMTLIAIESAAYEFMTETQAEEFILWMRDVYPYYQACEIYELLYGGIMTTFAATAEETEAKGVQVMNYIGSITDFDENGTPDITKRQQVYDFLVSSGNDQINDDMDKAINDLFPADTGIIKTGRPTNFTNVAPLISSSVSSTTNTRMRTMSTRAAATEDRIDAEGVESSKTVTDNGDGTYTVSIDAFATGSVRDVSVQEPMDIVLVLDVSGSMDKPYDYQVEGFKPYNGRNDDAYKNANFLYYNDNGVYRKVVVEIEEGWWSTTYTYLYYNAENNLIELATSSRDNGYAPDGIVIANRASENKMDALKKAVTDFIAIVDEKNENVSEDLKHRVALVKFAGDKKDTVGNDTYKDSDYTYNNSQIVAELTTDTDSVITKMNAINAAGATSADYGLQHAKTVLVNSTRKRLVLFFTDGTPNHGSGFTLSVANDAISAAYDLKQHKNAAGEFDTTIYSVCIESEANVGTTLPTGDKNINRFMHFISSNYPNATSMSGPTTGGSVLQPDGSSYYLTPASAGGLSSVFTQIANQVGSTSVTLGSETVIKDVMTDAFRVPEGADASSISVTIESHTGDNADGTPIFGNATTDANVKATVSEDGKTVSVTGFSFKDNYVVTETINNEKVYKGKRVVISFPIVVEDRFIGGNQVPTNELESGIYEDANATEPTENLPDSGTKDVPIKEFVIVAQDKNVYLKTVLNNEQLLHGALVSFKLDDGTWSTPEVLEDWQQAYVDIYNMQVVAPDDISQDGSYTIKAKVKPDYPGTYTEVERDATGVINVFTPVVTFNDTTVEYNTAISDTQYIISGTTAATYEAANRSQTVIWKHGDTLDASVTMIGIAPTLTFTYAPGPAGITDGKVTAIDYVPVNATVKIGEDDVTSYTTFEHAACGEENCAWTADKGEFLLHVLNAVGTLRIEKEFGPGIDANARAIVTVEGDGKTWTVVVGNGVPAVLKNMAPVTYTVTEDTSWTWRTGKENITYAIDGGTAQNGSSANVTVPGGNTVTIKFNNPKNTDKWLDDEHTVKNKQGEN